MSGRRRRRRLKPTLRPWWRLLDCMQRNMADVEAFLLEYHRAESASSRQICAWALWAKMVIIGDAAAQLDRVIEEGLFPEQLRKEIQLVDRWKLMDERERLMQAREDMDQAAVVKAAEVFRAEAEQIDESIYQEYLQSANAPGVGDE